MADKTLAILYIYSSNTVWTDIEVRNKNRIGQVPADQGKYRKPSAMGAPEKAAGYGLYTQMASDCTICKLMPKPIVIKNCVQPVSCTRQETTQSIKSKAATL